LSINTSFFPLPDFLIKDEKGDFTEVELKKWLIFNSKMVKATKASFKVIKKNNNQKLFDTTEINKNMSLVDFYSNSRLRQDLYCKFILQYIANKSSKDINLFSMNPRSIDLVTLNIFEERFFLNKASDSDVEKFVKNTGHITSKTFKLIDERTLHLWPKLLSDLNHFNDFDTEKQKLLIMVSQCFSILYEETKVRKFY